MSDQVNHPKHYNSNPSGVECITVVEHMKFNPGNAMKYLWRFEDKGDPIENLEKAKWYIDREIELIKERRSKEPLRIYVASYFPRKEEVKVIAEFLEKAGFVITEKWYENEMDFTQRPEHEKHSIASSAARADMLGVSLADVVVFLSESPDNPTLRGGRHVEFGYALGKKPIIVLGPRENVFHYLTPDSFNETVIHMELFQPHVLSTHLISKLRGICQRLGKGN